uniref:trehalose-phosphatase n=1 Tax=Parerythrobacter lutipelagi TaxID=1964208 RepID=UPI0010F99001|nr:trehalose-phosphatase [Parerythrobacter lutipelagi]
MVQPRQLPPPPSLEEIGAASPIALFLDFDGTLVPIASTPDGIDVPLNLADRLERLSIRLEHRMAIVSGRSPDNLAEHLGPAGIAVAGSHGAARITRDGSPLGSAARALSQDAIADIDAAARRVNVLLEKKSHGRALHYRAAPEREGAVLDLANEIAQKHGLATKRGKCVVELVVPGSDKGRAVKAFMAEAEFAGALPIFIGDDVTDEDGFLAASEIGGFGIAVGERPSKHARYNLSQTSDVHAWLNL